MCSSDLIIAKAKQDKLDAEKAILDAKEAEAKKVAEEEALKVQEEETTKDE